jgi:Ran GTPase-activating protein (RanGAP) involved in mRNA processing and transport
MIRYRTHVKPAFEEFIAPAEKLAHFTIYNNGRDGITNGKKITHKGVDLIADYIRLKIEDKNKVENLLIDM